MSGLRNHTLWPLVGAAAVLVLAFVAQLDLPVPTGAAPVALLPLCLFAMTCAAASARSGRSDIRRGAILVSVGVWLLISSLGLGGLDYSTSWPLLLVFIGLALVILPARCEGRAGGLALMAWGGLMWMAVNGVWGFTWANIWPLVLVIVGAQIAWRAIFDQRGRPAPDPENRPARRQRERR